MNREEIIEENLYLQEQVRDGKISIEEMKKRQYELWQKWKSAE